MSKVKDNEKKENEKDKLVIEEAFARLEEINKLLENPDTSLKESLSLYSEGVKLVNACKENLEGVEEQIQIINEE